MSTTSSVPAGSYGILSRTTADDAVTQAAERVRRLGYCVIDGGIVADELDALSRAFDHMCAKYRDRYGEDRLRLLDELYTIRAPVLHGGPWFARLAAWPSVLQLVRRLIHGRFILTQQNGIINPAGSTYNQGVWHRDLPYQHFTASRPLAINALFCLDEFRSDNGSTWVLPSSHLHECFPSESYVASEAVQVVAPRGSFIVLDAMTYHCGGENLSNAPRRAVNHVYGIPHLRQQIAFSKADAASSIPEEYHTLFGLGSAEPRDVKEFLSTRKASES